MLLLFSSVHHRPASSIVRITRICATHVHSCDRPRSTNAGSTFLEKKVKERGEGAKCGVECAQCTAAPPLPPSLLPLPLVQADGTKSIMYKDVKRNGSEMPDGVRMNGEGGGGLAGGRREEEQWARGTVKEEPERRWEPRQKRTRSYEEGPTPPVDGRNEPCENCTCALQCAK